MSTNRRSFIASFAGLFAGLALSNKQTPKLPAPAKLKVEGLEGVTWGYDPDPLRYDFIEGEYVSRDNQIEVATTNGDKWYPNPAWAQARYELDFKSGHIKLRENRSC